MLSQWWERISLKFINKIMLMARNDPDVSYDEYCELQRMYEEIYGKKFE